MSDADAREAVADDPVVAVMAEMGPDVLNRINVDFEDSILMVGRVLANRPDATATRVTALDSRGVDAVITDSTGEHTARVDFAEPVHDPNELTGALLKLVVRARAASGEDGVTTAEREMAEMAAIRTFLTRVVAVEDIHPHLRQITFGGGLESFEPAGPDTFMYLLVPPPGRTELGIDESFTWEKHAEMPEEDQLVGAYYTLRRWRPQTAELDILVVLHADAGHASAWAARAEPGDPAALWGPRTAYYPPPGTESLLLVADETGLPAVAVILEQLPAGMRAQVVAEVACEEERQPLPPRPDVDVVWLYRDGFAPGTTNLLAHAVRALPPLGDHVYVWGGGESHAMTEVRRHVREERGVDREAVSLVAYWRHRGTVDADPT
jgi:NADPH-dependent ferric siderophore reductase